MMRMCDSDDDGEEGLVLPSRRVLFTQKSTKCVHIE